MLGGHLLETKNKRIKTDFRYTCRPLTLPHFFFFSLAVLTQKMMELVIFPSASIKKTNWSTHLPHYAREKKLKRNKPPIILDLCFEKTRTGNEMIIKIRMFSKSFVFEMFSVATGKRKADVFKSSRFEERFRKVPFSWRISVDGRPNRRNKTAFLIFFLGRLHSALKFIAYKC